MHEPCETHSSNHDPGDKLQPVPTRRAAVLPVLALLLIVVACRGETPRSGPPATPSAALPPPGAPPSATPAAALASPAGLRSFAPRIAVSPDGATYMSWLERRDSTRHALRVARLEKNGWSAPRTVAEGDSLFANWADVPALLVLDRERLVAAYMWKSGGRPYAYDVRIVRSTDAGATWSRPVIPHRDGTATEHGFVSLLPAGGGAVRAVWLDGRNAASSAGPDHVDAGPWDMTLRSAVIDAGSRLTEEREIDPRVCECCPTAAATGAAGDLVAYRDRGADEVRDIGLITRGASGWGKPAFPHPDGWKIAGCPVNGPALDARGRNVALAWFAGKEPARVWVALSTDGGRAFGAATRVDDGDPLGRVGVALLDDGGAIVTWLERSGEEARVRARRVSAAGEAGEAVTVATTQAGRASGVPRIARSGDRFLVAWTDAAEPSRIGLAALPLR